MGKGTCTHAAGNGHWEVLKWARENGCPWNEWTRTRARQELTEDVFQRLDTIEEDLDVAL